MAITLNVRTHTLITTDGADLGTFTSLDELGDAFVAHFGKGYSGLAKKLVDALKGGKDTSRMEMVLGVSISKGYAAIAA